METTEARRESKDILFRRIGVDVPLSEGSEAFTDANAPVRGLAVSNRFGISFFVHSAGFVVTQTSSLVEVAQQAKDGINGKTAQQGCYLNVPVSGVRILDLSSDELTLAACVGDRAVHLYDVPSLICKLDKTPLESRDISEGRVKDFRWSPADDEIYALLSREGHLFSGRVGQAPLRGVDKGVIAVSWSPDGKHVSYLTSERTVCVCNSKFESLYTFNLPAEIGDVTENLQGESLQWIRPDAMLVAYTQTNEEEEEECPLILVTSRDGDLAKEGGTITGVVFDNTFPSIDSRVIPAGSGPYMLAEYIKPWEMVIAASRRSVDDHIVILGWFSEEKKHEALSIELTNDTWLPRIELQENGDDNVLLGLAVGMTTTELRVTDPRDDSGDTDLPACPVLMCLSLGGKLSLFSVARLDESASAATLVSPPSNLPESNRAEVKSNTSVDMPAKAPQAVPIDKESPGLQDTRIKQAEERIEDESSLSSGSETDRENDGNLNDEVLPRFPSQGRFGSLLETQRKSLSKKDSSFVSAKDTSSVSSLQTPGASALSSLASTGSSHINSLSTAKSAPSGLDQIQQTGSTPQLPVTLTRSVSQVQSPSSQTTFPQSTPFLSQSSGSLKHSQTSGPSLFGQAGNDKGSGQFTSSFQPSSSSSLSSALPSGSLRSPQSSGFGLFGQAANDKGSDQTTSSFQPSSSSSLSSALPSGSLRSPQSSGFGLFGQAGNEKGSGQFTSSFQPSSSSSLSSALPSGSHRSPQSSGFGLFGQAANDKGSGQFTSSFQPSSSSSLSPALSSGSLRSPQSSGLGLFGQAGNEKGTSSQSSSSFLPMGTAASLSSGSPRPQQSSGFGFDKGTRAPTSAPKPSPLERGPPTGPQKIPASGARTLAVTSARQSGVSEPEQAFIVELEKIKKMADEVDNLMAYIEGRGQRTASNQPPCFTKQSLNELELGIRTLADNCKTVKERVEEERHSLNNLRDENLQVDAWRLYVQSLAEQAAENRHQELWCRRKLTPDLEVKRKRVTKSEQALKQQIAALEEHVHHLELDNRKRVISLKDGKNNLNRQSSTGRSQSIQNLYSTVNGLLSSADRLSQQVSQQMEALNISAQPQTSQKIMKSVGLSSEDTLHMHSRPSFSRAVASPLARQQSIHSPALKAELGLPIHTTPPRRTMPSDSGVGAPSVTRRRRDSMDGVQKALALAGGASPKTTIERVSYHTPSQQPNPSSTSSNMLVKHIRQRSFQESSEESSAPRHVRRVLSSQTRSATSSPAPSTSTPENKGLSLSSGFSANSAISSLQGSQSSATLFEQQSGDGRPDSKRASPRNASSFAEKSVLTMASRFGPPPGRTTTTQTMALSSSSNAVSGSSFGPSPSNAPSPSVFKFTINNPPNAASSFSFATPSVAKPAVPLEPSGKPASNMGTTETLIAGSSTKFSSSPSPVFGSAGSTTKLAVESPKFGVDPNSTFLVDSGKDERPGFGFKTASFGTPTFGTPSFSSSSFSRSSLTGPIQDASTPSSNSFTLSAPTTRVPGSREGDTASHKNDAKQALPLTPAAQTISNQSTVGKATGNPDLSFSTTVSQTIPTPSSVAPSSAAKSTLFGKASTTVAAPSNLLVSQAQGGQPPSSLNVPASTPNLKPTSSPVGNMLFAPTSSSSTTPSSSSQTSFVFPAASTPTATFSVPPITTPDTDEEDMDEEQVAGGTASLGGFNLGGLGIGSSTPAPSQAPKTNLFGGLAPFGTQSTSSAFGTQQTASVFGSQPTSSAFGTQPTSSALGTQPTSSVFGTQPTSSAFGIQPTSSAFGTSSPQGQLFRPPSFSLPSAQAPPQSSGGFGFGNPSSLQSGASPFGSAFGSTTANPPSGNPFGPTPGETSPAFGSPGQPGAGGFGQPSQLGPGQQALGSALGAFGQTRQMGFGSTTPFGSAPSSGFGNAASGGGFPSAGVGGGFASAGTGGGFASASTGGGFAGAATGGGFAGAAGASGGGFSGVTGGGGFQAFGGNAIGSGGFGGVGQPAFGTTSPPTQSLFTQMRK